MVLVVDFLARIDVMSRSASAGRSAHLEQIYLMRSTDVGERDAESATGRPRRCPRCEAENQNARLAPLGGSGGDRRGLGQAAATDATPGKSDGRWAAWPARYAAAAGAGLRSRLAAGLAAARSVLASCCAPPVLAAASVPPQELHGKKLLAEI